jgi:catechol 2,3-dioxygenase-like lactoylglutathione lyase family enzyme
MPQSSEGVDLRDRKLVQVALTSRDLDRSRSFYRDTLGLSLLFEAGSMLFFDVSGFRLLIGTEKYRRPSRRLRALFRCAGHRYARARA